MSKLNNAAQRHRRDPDQAFGRKKPEAIYNADTRLPQRQPRLVRLGLSSTDAHFVFCYLPQKRVTNTLFAHVVLSFLLIQTHKHGIWTLHCLSSCIRTILLSPKSWQNETSTTPHEHSQCLSRVNRRSRTQQGNPVTVETPILSVPPRHGERQWQYVSPIRSIMLRARVQHTAFQDKASLRATT